VKKTVLTKKTAVAIALTVVGTVRATDGDWVAGVADDGTRLEEKIEPNSRVTGPDGSLAKYRIWVRIHGAASGHEERYLQVLAEVQCASGPRSFRFVQGAYYKADGTLEISLQGGATAWAFVQPNTIPEWFTAQCAITRSSAVNQTTARAVQP
jgi:hypothetical protein